MFRLLFILLLFLFFFIATPRLQAISDTNQNGVSDPWEKFFNSGQLLTTFTPTADSDGDAWTDSQEAIAGTDPRSGNTLTGQVRPRLIHTRAVFSPATPPTLLTPEAITLTWPTLAGKKYTLFFSPNLTALSWTQIGEPRIGAGTEIGTGIPFTQPDGTTPAAGFWRVTIADIDTDNDTLTDAEEHQLGSNPNSADTDSDGLTDQWEQNHGLDLTDNGSQNINNGPNGDPDGDGLTNAEELAAGSHPQDSRPPIALFKRLDNSDGTVTFSWMSFASQGEWFQIETQRPDGSLKTLYATTYGSAKLPFIFGKRFYTLTLNPATDFIP